MTSAQPRAIARDFFVGGGEMAALMGSLDWSKTPLGLIETWSPSLRTALSICLNSRFPMVIWWGKELVLLYNDAWRPILGSKHPNSLGKPGQQVWAEIWDIIGAQLNSVLETGEATWSEDMLLLVDRFGYTEEAYFTYSYSPIFLETGAIGGAFTAVTETTQRVIGERQLRSLRELAAKTAEVKAVKETCRIACETLTSNPYDIPFALLYLIEDEGKHARLVGTTGIKAETSASPAQVDLTQDTDHWELSQVQKTAEAVLINDLTTRFGGLPGGTWQEPARSAIVLPIAQSGQKQQLAGFLVLGISPRREFDDKYRGFFDLVTSHVATAIADASAYEEERKRADALAELDRAKTVFFSNVSHEFRTPLTLMLGPLEDLLSQHLEFLTTNEREQLQTVHRNSLRLLKLVNTLLDFSRIEAGRSQAVYEPTDLGRFTEELASVFRSAIERAGMQLVVNCPPLAEPVYIDREMWEKIVLNLLSNAFKFTFEGEITVALHWAEAQVELVVKDTGTGISVDEIPHLFKRFHRVPGARGRIYEGSGIGLSLVQELVKLHGGEIKVTSVVGQGTCFTVSIATGTEHLPPERISATPTLASTPTGVASYLEEVLRWFPEGRSGELEVQSEALGPDPKNNSPRSLPSARILLADDNVDMRGYVKRLLSQQYQVEAVGDGAAALAAAQQQRPDLILTDVMMPQLDGFGLLRELRNQPSTRDIPIILLSARAGEEARIEGLTAGADDYLIKPFSARELLARVEASLKLASLRRETTQQEQALRLEAEVAQQSVETILSSINDGFLVLDHNWCYTYTNDRNCEIIGMPRSEVLGKNIWELFPDLVGTEAYVNFQQSMAEQTAVQFEYFYPTWNRWFENRVYPSPNALTVFVADITDRKQIEENLQQTNQTLRTLIEASPLAIVVIQPACIVQLWNPAAEQLFGWSEAEVLGLPIPIVPEEKREECQQVREAVAKGETFFGVETYRKKRDGSAVIVNISAAPLYGDDGSVNQILLIFQDITEQQQAQEIVRQQREQLQLFVQHVPVEVAMFDQDMRYLYVSNRWLTSYGFSGQNIIGRSHYDVFPNMPQQWKDVHQRCLAGAVEECSEAPFSHASGFDWIHWEIRPWYTSTNQIGGIIIFSEVITQRKQAEEALRRSEEQFRNMADNAPFMVWVTDPTGCCTYLSQSWYDFTGQTEESGLGFGWLDLTHPDDREHAERTFLAANERKEAFRLEYRLRRKDGEYIWAIDAASPWFGGDGQFKGYVGSVVDISERKCAEEALRYANERFEYAAAAVNCLIYDWDIEQDFVERTEGLTRILGYIFEEAEPTGAWWCERVHPEDLPRVQAEAAVVLATRDRYTAEYRVLNKDNQYIHVVDHGIVVSRAANGSPTRVIGSTVDVDDRKRAEAEREQLLAREQAAREQAERSNRIKDEFLAVLSHELRSPLNPILGWSKLLQDNKLDEAKTKYALKTIERNAKLQSELIEDLLDVSRILQGKLNLNVSSVNLASTIKAAIETVRLAAEAKSIKVEANFAPQEVQVLGDSTRLQQVMWNLLSNAVKFTPANGQVAVRLEQVSNEAQITVSDTGKGIHSDFLPHVFDYFQQEDGKTTRKFGGLGLGLAIVRHLVELHGGTVWAESQGEGLGATFTVRLPLMPIQLTGSRDYESSKLPLDLAGIQVLVVDDETDSREFVAFVLEQAGANVVTASSAGEAFAALTRLQPDILLSDIGMPEIDGYTLMQQVRALPLEQGGQLPAIALTAYAGDFNQQQAIASGFQMHIAKPVEPDELVRAVTNLIQGTG
ncbi:PAS domain S-box protein [Leptolyngbya sp. FACHB-261]|uniref:PAS domain S-box protein n=1 Tax=Leptolyngbya sp. FACHB-261 TaxID=2692806 RepID=UPI001688DA40|nr:PAS domain S-box protein [Leptolyngbya sp. FACHB-261]MBD2104098.1 PAS domain S-box protein [Leptolyngbya sp. FACHB-261]